jgi:hypothetical protein
MASWIGLETVSAWMLGAAAACLGAVLIATGMTDELLHIFRGASTEPWTRRP